MARTFKFFLCALILGFAVTGCGGGGDADSGSSKLTIVGSGS